MTRLRAVVRREYVERVRSRWFMATTLGAPLLMAVIVFLPMVMARGDGADDERSLVVVDRTGSLGPAVAAGLEELGYRVEAAPDGDESSLTGRVLGGELAGYLVLSRETLRDGRARLRVRERPSRMERLALRSVVVRAALEVRLRERGAEGLLEGGTLELDVVGGGAPEDDEPRFVGAFAGAMLLYFVIFFYAQAVLRSVLEEKTSRVVEIVLSSVRPWELMLGKILGVGAVGLTQLSVWLVSGAVLASLGLPAALAANPGLGDLEDLRQVLPGGGLVLLFGALFVLGYFLYSALYAAVGALCNSEEEAQQAQFPLVMVLVIPVVMIMPVLDEPGSATSVLLSLFPPFTPILLYPRAVAGAAAPWQIVVALVLMVLAILGTARVAGRIYRVGILMQGKRPSLPELWRWTRRT